MSTGCKKSKLDLKETYSYLDTKPFGTYAAKNIIEAGLYRSAEIVDETFTRTYAISSDTNAVYFCISRNLIVNEDEAQSMLDYVYMGNSLFISASYIDSILLSKLYCKVVNRDLPDRIILPYGVSDVSLVREADSTASTYSYFYKPFANYFSTIQAQYSTVIGYNENKEANAFILFCGKGRLILHCDPRAFSNYFLLKDNNYRYLQNLLRMTEASPDRIYWDDHYRKKSAGQAAGDYSTFGELGKHLSLSMALLLLVLLLLFFLLFNGKRRQRIVPVVKPNENSSVAFTETIARLYLQHHDNKNIAGKMITYFNEYIHKNYFLNANATNSDLISVLSRKSGVSFDNTQELYNMIDLINNSEEISDQQLLDLNKKLQEFYKN